MGKKRRLITSSEDEEEERPAPSTSAKKKRGQEEDRESEENSKKKKKKKGRGDEDEEEEEEEALQEDAKPVGDVIRTSGKARGKKNHYSAFEYDGNHFELVNHHLLYLLVILLIDVGIVMPGF